GANVLLFVWAIRTSAFASVVDPAHEVVVVGLLADAGQVRRKGAALHVAAFSDGVAGETAAGFEEFLAMFSVARLLLWKLVGESRLPDVRRDRLDLVIGEAKVRHLGRR